ncbi:MAG TPA: tetratricopeptide repeat protein, partial [Spirochaetales bacterium]|nr:tetratricopeptide repeat protein [Spirochaetales bacterium]
MNHTGKNLEPSSIQRAMAEYRSGDYEAALLSLAETQVSEEDYLELAYVLGLCHVRLQRWDEALLYLEQVVTSGMEGPRVLQCRQTLAYVYALTGRAKLAEYELKKLVEAGTETPQVYATLGYAAWSQGRLEDGLSWYSKALELDPENTNALNGQGYLLACSGRDLPKALTSCRKALDGKPNNPAY